MSSNIIGPQSYKAFLQTELTCHWEFQLISLLEGWIKGLPTAKIEKLITLTHSSCQSKSNKKKIELTLKEIILNSKESLN